MSAVEQDIQYAKVPLDVYRVAEALPNQGQQDKLLGAYIRYFFTGDAGKVPKTIEPYFRMVQGVADRIKTGMRTGGIRTDGTGEEQDSTSSNFLEEVGKKFEEVGTSYQEVERSTEEVERSTEEVGEKSVRSRVEVEKNLETSFDRNDTVPAETRSYPQTSPATGPSTLYKDKDIDIDKYKDKDKEYVASVVSEVVDHFNERAGTNYRKENPNTVELITSLLKRGHTVEDMRLVIDTKAEEWLHNKKMCSFIRPSTLFGNKFEKYLEEARNKPRPYAEYDFF